MTKPIKQQYMYRHILAGLQHQPFVEGVAPPPKLPADLARHFPLKILIAEDNKINQEVILFILQKLGYDPVVVENGHQAVQAVHKTSFDIILMDLQMPEMDGLEATHIIRRTVPEQPVIIALTANTMEGDETECLIAGMNDYIGKPVRLEELTGKLRKWALYKKGPSQ